MLEVGPTEALGPDQLGVSQQLCDRSTGRLASALALSRIQGQAPGFDLNRFSSLRPFFSWWRYLISEAIGILQASTDYV